MESSSHHQFCSVRFLTMVTQEYLAFKLHVFIFNSVTPWQIINANVKQMGTVILGDKHIL